MIIISESQFECGIVALHPSALSTGLCEIYFRISFL